MPTENEISEVLDQIAGYVEHIEDEIVNEHHPSVLIMVPNPETGSIELTGHRCRRNDSYYHIGAHPDLRYVKVSYYLSLIDNIASDLSHDAAKQVLQAANLGWDDGAAPKRAAKYLLNNFKREEETDFRSYFKIAMKSPHYETSINMSESGRMESYSIDTKLFPYDEELTISEFEEAVQTVVGAGEKSAEVVWRNLSTVVGEDNLQDARLTFRGVK